MQKFRTLLLLALVASALWVTGCSSSNSTIAVTLSPTTAPTINQGQTQTITAVVSNDPSNKGVTWSLSGPGTLSASTATSVTYDAPPALAANSSATVTATAVASTTATASLSITVNSLLGISTTALAPATLGTPYYGFVNAEGATGTFTWSVSAGALPAGLTLAASTTNSVVISGIPTAAGSSSFTIQVTDSASTTASQALTLKVNPPPPLSVMTTSLPPGSVGAAYDQTLQGRSGTKPYTWSMTGGALPAGLALSSAGLISGTPTSTGTSSFTVQVVDSSSPAQTANGTLSITINPAISANSRLNGNYAFLVSGFDGNGAYATAASLVADGNGNITGGIMDTSDPAAALTNQSFTGTYSVDASNLGTMTLSSGQTFAFSLMQGGDAKIIQFDGTANGSGMLMKQATGGFSNAQINNNYAFGFIGADSQSNRFGMAGAFHADGAGNITSGMLDSDNSNSGMQSSVAFTGTYSVAPNGRGTATITVPGQSPANYSFYVASNGQLLMMETDSVAGGSPLVSGLVLPQSGNNSFATGSLNGASFFCLSALEISGGSSAAQSQAGFVITDGSGNFSLTSDQNTGGTAASLSGQGTYTVALNGRVTFATQGNSGFQNSQPVLYLTTANQGFVIGTDSQVSFGLFISQTGQPFVNQSFAGAYAGGSLPAVDSTASNQIDAAIADGAGNVSFTTDISSIGGGVTQNQTATGTYSLLANGQGTLTENGIAAGIVSMVSTGELVIVSSDTNAQIEDFQQ